jgi:AhpD family alkylhydroperoxidase
MAPRLTLQDIPAGAYQAVLGMENYIRGNVEGPLLELIKLRASMVNGCAYCVDMHSRDALAAGESSRRLFGVAAWHEAPFYTARERAALALTDAVTRLGDEGVSDDVWDQARKEFTDEELANVLMAIATINVWNRLAITTRTQPPETV